MYLLKAFIPLQLGLWASCASRTCCPLRRADHCQIQLPIRKKQVPYCPVIGQFIVKHCWCVMKQYFHTVKHSCSEFAYNEFRLTMKQVSFYLVLKHIKFDKYSNFLQQQIKMSSPGNVAISVLYCLSTHYMNHYDRIYE